MNIFLGFICGFLAQALAFIQLQGQFKWPFLAKHSNWLVLLGIPISWLLIKSVKFFVDAFDGMIWPSRIIGFSIGITVFALMSHIIFNEGISLKTGVCLLLGFSILAIQLFWK